jgi:hypothetical protein
MKRAWTKHNAGFKAKVALAGNQAGPKQHHPAAQQY